MGRDNTTRSEGPWGRAADAARMTVLVRAIPPAQNGDSVSASGEYVGGMQTSRRDTWTPHGQAPLDMSALKPYRGKPAVRNFRGDDGDVGIIRSPVRAIALPDSHSFNDLQTHEGGLKYGVPLFCRLSSKKQAQS